MASDASNEFFWHEMQTNDNGSDLHIQRITLDGFVTDQDQTLGIHAEDSSSPPGLISVNADNTSNSPSSTSTSQAVLPIGVINPDAIIPQTRSYTCRICQVTFPNKSAVTVHSRVHTNHEGKPYRCSFCNKGFSTNFYLKQHERIHNGQKPYKCPMCEQSFKQLSHVQQHVRTHTGVRPYKCHWPGCGKAFLQQSHLKSHIARHSPKQTNGLRPYKCHWPECGKSFAQISNLKSHIARHTPKSKVPKNSSASNQSEAINEQQQIALMPEKREQIELADNQSSMMSPDVIGQAAAAANIVPTQVQIGGGGEYESICPFLCPGCSKLYVREATFKKHLEECKTKLQMSISATAAALGIDPPPLPSPTGHVSAYLMDNSGLPIDMPLTEDPGASGERVKKSRKTSKPRLQQPVLGELVEMPLDIIQGNSSTNLSDAAITSDCSIVKQEMIDIPLDNAASGGVMFRLPQHILSAVGVNDDSGTVPTTSINSVFSYNPSSPHVLDGAFLSSQQLATSSTTVNLPVNVSQSLMISGANVDKNDTTRHIKTDGNDGDGHTTINQSALRWQWDQPSAPRMNFP